jgi:hypothetical protein
MILIRVRALLALMALLVLAVACASSRNSDPFVTASNLQSAAAPSSASASDDGAIAACDARNSGTEPDVLFRFKDPGTDWITQRLGGGYNYNVGLGQCMSAADFLLSTVPDGAGHCGHVALASDNPGYDENVDGPAPPLSGVIASKGNCAD